MKIVYDARMILFPNTGLGRFTGSLISELLANENYKDDFFYVLVSSKTSKDNIYLSIISSFERKNKCKIILLKSEPVSLLQHFILPLYVNKLSADLYIHTHFDVPFFINIKSICVIHDLFPLIVKDYIVKYSLLKRIYFSVMLKIVAIKCSLIFTVSETTKNDLLNFIGFKYKSKVVVCYLGQSLNKNINSINENKIYGRYLLYVGDRRPHKNLKRIIDVFISLKQHGYIGKLLLVGSAENYDFSLEDYVRPLNCIELIGPVSDNNLICLYNNMDALIFLSKYEGFGLPVIEAALLSKKVIISDGGALNEIKPPWSFLIPNNADINQIIPQLKEYLDNDIFLDKNYGVNYTWHEVANKFAIMKDFNKYE